MTDTNEQPSNKGTWKDALDGRGRILEPPGESEPAAQEIRQRLLAETFGSNVQVITRRDALTSPDFAGSGFLVDNGRTILTNAHVVAGGREHYVALPDGTVEKARVRQFNFIDDIATLELINPKSKFPPIAFSERPPKSGSKAFAFGHPLADEKLTETSGYIIGTITERESLGLPDERFNHLTPLEKLQMTRPMLNCTVPIEHGNSGGPVLDETGRLIGMATSTTPDGQYMQAIPSSTLWKHLTKPSTQTFKYTKFREAYAANYLNELTEDPMKTLANTSLAAAAANINIRALAQYRRGGGLSAVATGIGLAYYDLNRYNTSMNSMEMVQSGMASACDGAMIGGGIALLARKNTLGVSTIIASAVGRMLTGFIPTGEYLRHVSNSATDGKSTMSSAGETAVTVGSLGTFGKGRTRMIGMGLLVGGTVARRISSEIQSPTDDRIYWNIR